MMMSAKKCEIKNQNSTSILKSVLMSSVELEKKLSIKYKGKQYKKKNNIKELAKQHESTSKTIIRNLYLY